MVYLHNTYSISAELFINFDTKTVFFLCSRCCSNNSRTPGAHVAPWPQVGCSGRWLQIFSFVLIVILRADVSNEVMTPFCVPDIAGRGCKNLFLFEWFNVSFTFHISSALLRHSLFGIRTVSISSVLSFEEFLSWLMRRMLFKAKLLLQRPTDSAESTALLSFNYCF